MQPCCGRWLQANDPYCYFVERFKALNIDILEHIPFIGNSKIITYSLRDRMYLEDTGEIDAVLAWHDILNSVSEYRKRPVLHLVDEHNELFEGEEGKRPIDRKPFITYKKWTGPAMVVSEVCSLCASLMRYCVQMRGGLIIAGSAHSKFELNLPGQMDDILKFICTFTFEEVRFLATQPRAAIKVSLGLSEAVFERVALRLYDIIGGVSSEMRRVRLKLEANGVCDVDAPSKTDADTQSKTDADAPKEIVFQTEIAALSKTEENAAVRTVLALLKEHSDDASQRLQIRMKRVLERVGKKRFRVFVNHVIGYNPNDKTLGTAAVYDSGIVQGKGKNKRLLHSPARRAVIQFAVEHLDFKMVDFVSGAISC